MEDNQTASDRNIVDMIRADRSSGSKKNWKAFRDKLRLKRTGKAWISSVPIPTSDIPIKTPERQRSIRLLPLETDTQDEDGSESPDGEQKQVAGEGDQHMSLMTLLSTDGSHYIDDEDEHDEEHKQQDDDNDDDDDDDGTCDSQICCGCTVKHKGTPLGSCGHAFCKHCTKEHHVSKGNCPTCNNYILEILDIF